MTTTIVLLVIFLFITFPTLTNTKHQKTTSKKHHANFQQRIQSLTLMLSALLVRC
jgi:hypothetical protein